MGSQKITELINWRGSQNKSSGIRDSARLETKGLAKLGQADLATLGQVDLAKLGQVEKLKSEKFKI